MTLQEQINLITPGETLTTFERAEAECQKAEVEHMLVLIPHRDRRASAWAEAREGMGWDGRPLWWQHETLLQWFPVHVIQRFPGDTEGVLLEEAGRPLFARLEGEETSAASAQARGARVAARGTRLLRRLMASDAA